MASAFWLWTFAFGRSVCFRIRPETLNYEGFREQAPNAEHPTERQSAGEGNRTLVCSLGSCRSTIELHPHLIGLVAYRRSFRPAPRLRSRHFAPFAGFYVELHHSFCPHPHQLVLQGVGTLAAGIEAQLQ